MHDLPRLLRSFPVEAGTMILVAGALLAAALGASLLAGRLRLPGLVLFLGRRDGRRHRRARLDRLRRLRAGARRRDRRAGADPVRGRPRAGFGEIRPVLRPALSLAVVGTLITAVIAGLAASWLFDFSPLEGLLLGSIVAATDGAAIFAMLRGSTLQRRLARTLEGEAGFNDPVAVLLVVGFIALDPDARLRPRGHGAAVRAGDRRSARVVGGAIGVAPSAPSRACGSPRPASTRSRRSPRRRSPSAPPTRCTGPASSPSTSCGLMLGSATIPARRTITTFHDGLAWIAQLGMFLMLGLLVFPRQLADVALEGTVLALVLVRRRAPAGACSRGGRSALHGAPSGSSLGWAGLRGAVPVVLATFPVIDGVAQPRSSSTSSSSRCCSRPCCRARRSSRSPGGSA